MGLLNRERVENEPAATGIFRIGPVYHGRLSQHWRHARCQYFRCKSSGMHREGSLRGVWALCHVPDKERVAYRSKYLGPPEQALYKEEHSPSLLSTAAQSTPHHTDLSRPLLARKHRNRDTTLSYGLLYLSLSGSSAFSALPSWRLPRRLDCF